MRVWACAVALLALACADATSAGLCDVCFDSKPVSLTFVFPGFSKLFHEQDAGKAGLSTNFVYDASMLIKVSLVCCASPCEVVGCFHLCSLRICCHDVSQLLP